MRRCPWLLTLAACGAVEPAAPLPDAAGPPPVTFTYPRPVYEGMPGTYAVDAPGGGAFQVAIAIGHGYRGNTCLPSPAVCFDMEDARVILTGRADANGHFEGVYTEGPRDFRSPPLSDVQAIVRFPDGTVASAGPRPRSLLFGVPNGGFSWWEELWFNLGDLSWDRDGGETRDFQELRFDGTDLADPSDDVPIEHDCAFDGDGDGMAEDDPDCRPELVAFEYDCLDGVDDDADGLDDCQDPDCASYNFCSEQTCDDGVDDDADGLVDCADPDCAVAACKDEVVAWLDPSVYFLLPAAQGIQWAGPVHGVATTTVGGAAIACDWDASGSVDAWRCGLREAPLPDPTTLTFDPAIGLMRADGTVLATADGMAQNRYRVRVRAPVPFADCSNGQPPQVFWRDADGDGYGVDDTVPGNDTRTVLACATTVAGFSPVQGDCHDGDASWTPSTVTLPPGATCLNVTILDHDGDGVDRFHDADDRDGGVP